VTCSNASLFFSVFPKKVLGTDSLFIWSVPSSPSELLVGIRKGSIHIIST
jgi:hypothetical protein